MRVFVSGVFYLCLTYTIYPLQGMLTKDGTPFEPPQEVENSYMDPVTGEVKVVKTLVGGTKYVT